MFRTQLRRARALGFGLLTTLAVMLALPASAFADNGTSGTTNTGGERDLAAGFGLEVWEALVLGVVLIAGTLLVLRETRSHH
jgi:hypothetical protein